MQNMWNRNNGTAQEAFALRFIFTAPDHREVHCTHFHLAHQAGLSWCLEMPALSALPSTVIWIEILKSADAGYDSYCNR